MHLKGGNTLKRLFQTSEFAEKVGITARTLRYYDQIGLLKPTQRSAVGHRLYSEDDIIILQQILTLKFLGLSLEEIKKNIRIEPTELKLMLKMQRKIFQEKIADLEMIYKAISEAVELLNQESRLDWEKFIHVIKVVRTMEENKLQTEKWVKQFFSAEQSEQIKKREFTVQDHQRVEQRWEDLMKEVQKSLDKDPASLEVQRLVEKWLALSNQFTQGNPGLEAGLHQMYENLDDMPLETKKIDQGAMSFIKKAIEIYNQK